MTPSGRRAAGGGLGLGLGRSTDTPRPSSRERQQGALWDQIVPARLHEVNVLGLDMATQRHGADADLASCLDKRDQAFSLHGRQDSSLRADNNTFPTLSHPSPRVYHKETRFLEHTWPLRA